MKILYGVSGEGFGHSSRAKEVIKYLKSKDHEVLVLTYGKGYKALKQYSPFKIWGISLISNEGKLSLWKTFTKNTASFIKKNNLVKLQKKIKIFQPDLCITDFEPLTAIASFWLKKPLISIDNQHRFTNLEINVPKKYKKDYLITKSIVNKCVSKAEAFLVLSFTKNKIKKENTVIVSPLLRKEILELDPKKEDYLLVYLTKPNKKLMNILKDLPEKFIVYGQKNQRKTQGNITFKPLGKDFIKDLENCKAIIATAGFTLISEAVYLKKPYLAIPFEGQFEQTFNAIFLEESGLGEFMEKPSKEKIISFLNNLEKHEKRLNNHSTNPKEALNALEKIIKRINSP